MCFEIILEEVLPKSVFFKKALDFILSKRKKTLNNLSKDHQTFPFNSRWLTFDFFEKNKKRWESRKNRGIFLEEEFDKL